MSRLNAEEWRELLEELPAGLSLAAISAKVKGSAKTTVMRQLKKFRYEYGDGRVGRQKISSKWEQADWGKTNSELSSLMGVSAQRVSVMRRRLSDRSTVQPIIDSADH